MKFAVWGTGIYYQEFKKYINVNEIKYLVDNKKEKQGKLLDGKIICAPNQIDYNQCDYVIILVKHYDKIRQQILEMKVPLEKIISYQDLQRVLNIRIPVVSYGKELTLQQWICQHTGVKIFVFSHNLSRSGVPVALMNLVLLLRKMGYAVLFGALGTGGLCEELREYNIDYISDLQLICHDPQFLAILKEFDLAVVGTLALSEFGTLISNIGFPILWWLHESNENFYLECKLPQDIKQIHYFAVGNRVKNAFWHFYPREEIKELLYYLPDTKKKKNVVKNKRMIFAVIGVIGERKAQDIVVKALEQIPKIKREQMQVLFVGAVSDEKKQEWADIQRHIPQIHFIGEITQNQVDKLYERIDILICPSRCDPMPIVVTQAMQHEIPCIVSDQVGQSEFLKDGIGGFVFPNENVKELAKLMMWCMEYPDCLKEKGQQARRIYEKYFTEAIMREKLEVILGAIILGKYK